MAFDPIAATGVVALRGEGERLTTLGSFAAFRQPHVVLTAAHCLRGYAGEPLELHFPRRGEVRAVSTVVAHPTADVAAVFSEPDEGDDFTGYPPNAFWNFVANVGLSEEFFAFGYPVEGPWQDLAPTGRAFRGYFQRFFDFKSPAGGYRYAAAELSIAAPEGLSGGPLFRPGALQMLTGIVTSNLEASTAIDSWEDEPGRRIERHRVISYGVALMLHSVETWLDEVVPQRRGPGRRD